VARVQIYSVLPALFHGLSDTLDVFFAVVLVKVRGFDVGRGRGVRVIEQTIRPELDNHPMRNKSFPGFTSGY